MHQRCAPAPEILLTAQRQASDRADIPAALRGDQIKIGVSNESWSHKSDAQGKRFLDFDSEGVDEPMERQRTTIAIKHALGSSS